MAKDYSITKYFGSNLAELLSDKILPIHQDFPYKSYIDEIKKGCNGLSYTERVVLHAENLKKFLPKDYSDAINILLQILGPENPNQTGMFKHYYWILPLGKYVEKYGLSYFDISIGAIEEITKRNTGEYAVRPYIREYPDQMISKLKEWAQSDNFH